jgi:hypothetical protein
MTDTKRAPVPPARNFCRSLTEVLHNGRASLLAHAVEPRLATLLERRAEEVVDNGRRRPVRHGA